MEALLKLLLSLFKDLDSVQRLLAKLAEIVLGDIPDPNGCKQKVLEWLKAGALDDEFQKDPICVVICLAYTVLAVISKLHGHDHEPNVILAEPDAGYYGELAEALQCPAPVGAEGPLSGILLQLILAELTKLLKKYLDGWLS